MIPTVPCSSCGERPFSLADRAYTVIYGRGWCCDKKLWEEGKLSLETFEDRETAASDMAVASMKS